MLRKVLQDLPHCSHLSGYAVTSIKKECFQKGFVGKKIWVEGNIASGKTSFLDKLLAQSQSTVEIVKEPVNKWTNLRGHNLLDLMYQDPSRWSLAFQNYVQLTMLQHHICSQTAELQFLERSVFSARFCFVEHLYQSGHMTSVEYAVLSEWFDWIVSTIPLPVNRIIYIKTDPVMAYERLKRRGRQEETEVSLDYLIALDSLHDDWLLKKKFPLPAPVTEIDGSNLLGFSLEPLLMDLKDEGVHSANSDLQHQNRIQSML